jgi:hypothetical protein
VFSLLRLMLCSLFTALRHIAEVTRPRERCLILTGSLSLIKIMLFRRIAHQTHPLVYECKGEVDVESVTRETGGK